MIQKRWTDIDVEVSIEDYREFEDWCNLLRLRFDHQPAYEIGRPVPMPRSLGKTTSTDFVPRRRIYRVWGKYPDRVMLCKLTWQGRS
jgi:hypothetical protein